MTLLIATGIVLIAGLLIITGVIAGSLRDRALAATEREVTRIDTVLADAGSRNFHTADAVLGAIADRLGNRDPDATVAAMTSPDIGATLASAVGAASPLTTLALLGRDGAVLNTIGWWPPNASDIADLDFFKSLAAHGEEQFAIGAPIEDLRDGDWLIPVARRIVDRYGTTRGYLAGAFSTADFLTLFSRIPLDGEGSISLVRHDGTLLVRYPDWSSMIGEIVPGERLRALLASGGTATISEAGPDGDVEIKAVRGVAGYPVSVLVARSENGELGGWGHQARLFAVFALVGAIVVAAMLHLIGRQFRAHAALATIRAEKIKMEHARLVAEAELLKKDRLSVLGQLTATVAHELRNPLSAIRNTLFSLKEAVLGSGLTLDRQIARMERSIERCNRIIGDLLEYARARELRYGEVAIDPWLAEILAEQNVPAGVTLVETYECAGISVMIDAERIRRVVINLVENAAQAMAEAPDETGERGRHIGVRTRAVEGNIELLVDDAGPGIPPENLERIFEPLFSTRSFGTGLGLATVKQIVGQHGGTVEVQSEVGRGTRFVVRLPGGEVATKVAA